MIDEAFPKKPEFRRNRTRVLSVTLKTPLANNTQKLRTKVSRLMVCECCRSLYANYYGTVCSVNDCGSRMFTFCEHRHSMSPRDCATLFHKRNYLSKQGEKVKLNPTREVWLHPSSEMYSRFFHSPSFNKKKIFTIVFEFLVKWNLETIVWQKMFINGTANNIIYVNCPQKNIIFASVSMGNRTG